MTSSDHDGPPAPLASVPWLAEHGRDPNLLVLDIRSTESGGAEGFAAGHIPRAVHSDYAADGWRAVKGAAGGALPDPDDLARLFGRLGLRPERVVIIASAGLGPSDFSAAARVFWTLRVAGHRAVSILDGGYRAWQAAGQPIERGPARAVAAAPYPVRLDERLRASLAAVEQALGSGAALVDGRSRAQFEGADKSPVAARAGRLPGAIHRDHTALFEPGTGRLRPPAELEALFAEVPAGPVVSYCNTGHLASANWFVLSEVLKRPGIALYDGSMSEWTSDPSRPVVVGADERGSG